MRRVVNLCRNLYGLRQRSLLPRRVGRLRPIIEQSLECQSTAQARRRSARPRNRGAGGLLALLLCLLGRDYHYLGVHWAGERDRRFDRPGFLPEDGFANRCCTDLIGLICRLAGSLVIATLSSTVRFASEIFVCSECDRCSATALVASELGSTRFLTGLRCATGWLDGNFFSSARRLIDEAGRDHLTMTLLLRGRTVFWGGSVLPSNRSSRA